jgi:hypothetical protein
VRSGVGLPTRGAAARFAVTVAGCVGGGAFKAHAPALLKTLSSCLDDASPGRP